MKPLYEETLQEAYIYHGRIINLRNDTVRLENGSTASREVIEHSGGVCVVAIDDENRIYMVRQYRYPYKEVLLEIPAGKLTPGEKPTDCGKRELEEETGLSANELVSLGQLYPTPGYVGEILYMYLAQGLRQKQQHLDEDEFLEVVKVPFDEALGMVLHGEIKDAKTQAAIMKVRLLKDAGEL
ncbi:NUDIX domain-containing protein [Candidatus Soleaferrea massiliensis]|uniref:NUDIX domain-containing protein n=1 Tax=Candidatus Soleaferrea massiliensis TaxID=1470354 RepID=UPI000590F740|nr:NUDIX hydrolase [Candidatus Soleaferrea massiliensis]